MELLDVRRRVAQAAKAAGRDPLEITLIAVSKTFGREAIEPVIAESQRSFGENRVQEASAKWPALKSLYRDLDVHLIGPLQTNKVGDAVALFDCIHSLDRPKLAAALAREMAKQERRLKLFIQVNTGAEQQKA